MGHLAVLNSLFQMFDALIQMRIFDSGRLCMFQRVLRMLHAGISMPFFPVGSGGFRMFNRFSDMRVPTGERRPIQHGYATEQTHYGSYHQTVKYSLSHYALLHG